MLADIPEGALMSDRSPASGPPVYGSAPVAPPADDTWADYPSPPPRSRRTFWIVLGVVLALVVAAAIAAVVWLVPAITGALSEQNATIRTPDTVAGLVKSTDPDRQALATELEKQLAASTPDATTSVAAVYEDPADRTKVVILTGMTGKISSPEKELDKTFNSASVAATDVRAVDAGTLSGTAKCGKSDSQGLALVTCGWADHGSVAMVVFINRDIDASATLFKQIRNEVLVRN
jgi:cytoskeletal protein RodZ